MAVPGITPTLEELGWSDAFAQHMPKDNPDLRPARDVSVHAALVDLWTTEGPKLASLRRTARDEAPIEGGIAVGDWVAIAAVNDEVVVEAILPRRTAFLRQAAGERSEPQAIAANIDRVFIVTAGVKDEHDFNVRRLERYLVAIAAGGAEAQIILTKSDLATPEEAQTMLADAQALAPAFLTSAKNGDGVDELIARVPRGSTATLVGSSGVGKSALVNRLLGRVQQLEGEIRAYDGRGRHTTTRRELFLLPGAGLLIDTPGMRELKPWIPAGVAGQAEIDDAFDDIAAIADTCRYRDCRHENEPGCAIREALESNSVDRGRLESWQKLTREQADLSPRQAVFAKIEKKRHAKTLSVAARKRIREKS